MTNLQEAAKQYNQLSSNKRLGIALGLFTFSLVGLWGSSKLEQILPAQSKQSSTIHLEIDTEKRKLIEKELE
jgi:hypothetical protein